MKSLLFLIALFSFTSFSDTPTSEADAHPGVSLENLDYQLDIEAFPNLLDKVEKTSGDLDAGAWWWGEDEVEEEVCKWSQYVCPDGVTFREVCLVDGDGGGCTCGTITRPCPQDAEVEEGDVEVDVRVGN